jgi:hypothetical protein
VTDPPDLSRPAGSNTPSSRWAFGPMKFGGLDKLVSRINPGCESVSPLYPCKGVRGASGTAGSKKYQLKSLILAQPERWRRG